MQPGSLAPRQHEHLVRLAAWMPFAQAASLLADLLSVQVSTQTLRRLSEQMGACMQAAQDGLRATPTVSRAQPTPPPERRVLSVDGTMISLQHRQWVEVRTLTVGEPEVGEQEEGEREIHVAQVSSYSRLADAQTFTRQGEVELHRRGVQRAVSVCAVTDGARWCQDFVQAHRADALRVLDFAHAAEHLARLLEAVERAGYPLAAGELTRCLHELKHRGPAPLLRRFQQQDEPVAQQAEVAEEVGYFQRREALMDYPEYQQQGWPIGSGMVESANKHVVAARLKGAGMHWNPQHVNALLALRNAVCNQRWHEDWQQALRWGKRAYWRHSTICGPREPGSKKVGQQEPPADTSVASRARKRSAALQQPPSEAVPRPQQCPCGNVLLPSTSGSPRRFCSRACQARAYRLRRAALAANEPLPSLSALFPFAATPVLERTGVCPCGEPLPPRVRGFPRRYCSRACQARAYRFRHATASFSSG